MINRRDLLKFFTAGSIIAPVIGGVASATEHAVIIEAPKVEIAAPPKFRPADATDFLGYNMGLGYHKLAVTLLMRTLDDGTQARMDVARIDGVGYVNHWNLFSCEVGLVEQAVTMTFTGPLQMAIPSTNGGSGR
jgi:hypothetical protein